MGSPVPLWAKNPPSAGKVFATAAAPNSVAQQLSANESRAAARRLAAFQKQQQSSNAVTTRPFGDDKPILSPTRVADCRNIVSTSQAFQTNTTTGTFSSEAAMTRAESSSLLPSAPSHDTADFLVTLAETPSMLPCATIAGTVPEINSIDKTSPPGHSGGGGSEINVAATQAVHHQPHRTVAIAPPLAPTVTEKALVLQWPTNFQTLIRSSAVLCDSGLQWVTVCPANVDSLLPLVAAFHDLCRTEFEDHEMESLHTWVDNLRDGGRTAPYIQTFSLLVRLSDSALDEPPVVLGGAARELYPDSRCGLVSYIVISEALRGRRLAQRLMARAVADMTNILVQPLEALFVDVLQARDGLHGRFDAMTRQQIWQKMGFLPLDYDMVYPGHMKGGRYQVALFHDAASGTPAPTSFSAARLASFISGLFYSILVVDDKTVSRRDVAEEVHADIQRQLSAATASPVEHRCPDGTFEVGVAVGAKYWR